MSRPSPISAIIFGKVAGQHARRDVSRPAVLAEVVEPERPIGLAELGQGGSGLFPGLPLCHPEPPGLTCQDRAPPIRAMGVEHRPEVAVRLTPACFEAEGRAWSDTEADLV